MSLNLLDLFFVVFFILGIILGKEKKIVVEGVNLIGAVTALFVSLHYYLRFSIFLRKKFFIPETIAPLASYILLSVFIIVIFRLIQEGWLAIIDLDMKSATEKVVAYFLAVIRMYFITALLASGLLLVPKDAVVQRVRNASLGRIMIELGAEFYQFCYWTGVRHLFPNEELNNDFVNLVFGKKEVPLPKKETN